MKSLSEIISKQVLNLFSGKIEGTIKDVCFDDKYKKVTSLSMFDEQEEEFYILSNKIYSIGDKIVIKNNEGLISTINQAHTTINNPVHLQVYSISGQSFGAINDIEFDDKLFVVNFKTPNLSFKPQQIVNVASSVIINQTDKKVKLSDFRPRKISSLISEPTQQEIVKIMNPETDDWDSKQQNNNYKINASPSPQKIIGNSNFLLGRKVIRSIYSVNNNLLIKKESLITEKVLDIAKRNGKLAELTIYSVRK